MTPLIFMTAFSSDEISPADRYAEGAVDFMFTPVPAAQLCAKVAVFAALFLKARLLAIQAGEVQVALRAARDSAIGISKVRSAFLANMSHEIRTPINGVLGMTELLVATDLDGTQREYAESARQSGEAMLTVVNDILDFSEIEAGRLDINDVECDLRSVVDDLMVRPAEAAQAKGIGLTAVVDPSVPAVVVCDPGRVRQVLVRLVGNAVKFTDSGDVTVRVTAAGGGGGGPRTTVHFEVTDTGVGISADTLATVFDPFVQADTSPSRGYGGTGLGLAIGSRVVSLMGGEVGASSRPGIGSTFWFTVPAGVVDSGAGGSSTRPDADVAAAPTPTVDAGVAAPRRPTEVTPATTASLGRLLVAEDNVINQLVAVAMLRGAGYEVDTARNGSVAVEASASVAYDAILMDCHMPEMDGYEATAAIRVREGSLRHTPIIAVTAGAREEDRKRCLAGGMDAYLAKPVDNDSLLAVIGRFVTIPR